MDTAEAAGTTLTITLGNDTLPEWNEGHTVTFKPKDECVVVEGSIELFVPSDDNVVMVS